MTLRRPRHQGLRRLLAGTVAALATLALFAVAAPGASAHGDEGDMELTRLEQTGPNRVEVEVGIVYSNDGHLAEGATVTATLTRDDGTAVGPVDLPRRGEGSSLYGASVDLPAPGQWALSVTSTEPDAEVEGALVVDQAPEPSATGNGNGAEVDENALPNDPDLEPELQEPTSGSSIVEDAAVATDDGGLPMPLVIGGVAAVIAGVGSWLFRRRQAAQDAAPPVD